MATLADWFKSQTKDYGQLKDAYPNAKKFGSALKQNVSKLVPTTEDFQSPQKMGEWSMAAAMNAPMGLMFTGPKSTGWNQDAANTATKLLDNGADPSQVWKDHLIGRMPDGKLFSEIDDSGSIAIPNDKWGWANNIDYKAEGKAHGSVGEFLKHDDLHNNYHGMIDFGDANKRLGMTVRRGGGDGGSFGDNNITVGGAESLDGTGKINKSTALHELQHAIQDKEGWAEGGNPGMFNQQKEAELARDALSWRRELLNKRKEMPKADWYHVDNELVQDYQKQGIFDWVPNREVRDLASQPYILHADKYDNGAGLKDLEDLVKMYGLDNRTTAYKPFEAYQRLTGEAQARATQDRMNMNMQQRRDTYPLAGDKLSDIPLNQLINRYQNNGPSMSVTKNDSAGLSNNLADYVGSHTAPMKGDSAAPLHDLAAIYPDDIYSNKAAQYYGDYGGSHPMDRESINAMHSAKGRPNSLVTMFRAVPSEPTIQKQISLLEKQKAYIRKNGKVPRTANTSLDRSDYYDEISNQLDNLYAMPEQAAQPKPSINNGDWVTLSRTYAKEHGQSHLNNNYKILSKKVPARKLFTNADSIHEFGYDESGKANLGLLGGLAGAGTLGAYLYGNRGER